MKNSVADALRRQLSEIGLPDDADVRDFGNGPHALQGFFFTAVKD